MELSTSARSPQTGQVEVSVLILHFLQIYLIIFLLSLYNYLPHFLIFTHIFSPNSLYNTFA